MLDIKFIRQNPEKVKKGCRKKQVKVDITRVLTIDQEKRKYQKTLEELRAKQRRLSFETPLPLKKLTGIKKEIKKIEPRVKEKEQELKNLLLQIPNLPFDNVPEGKDEKENVVIKEWGVKPKFDFKPKDYLELAEKLDLIDVKRAAKISGTRFGILKKEAVFLKFALRNFASEILIKEGFIPIDPPVMIRPEIMQAMGYVERGRDEIYYLKDDNLCLIGTAEQALGPIHADEILEEKQLPKRYIAFTPCFRREAGSYGKDTKGIFRVHQFDKIEMFSFSHPQKSQKEHQFLLSCEEKLMQALKIPYRMVQICTGDLGDPAAAKYDIEAWLPGQGCYRETHSTSNCTDFQARRLNIRYKEKSGKLSFVYTLNGTAFAIGRILIAIFENYQQKDGSIKIPEVLQKYLGRKKVIR